MTGLFLSCEFVFVFVQSRVCGHTHALLLLNVKKVPKILVYIINNNEMQPNQCIFSINLKIYSFILLHGAKTRHTMELHVLCVLFPLTETAEFLYNRVV